MAGEAWEVRNPIRVCIEMEKDEGSNMERDEEKEFLERRWGFERGAGMGLAL